MDKNVGFLESLPPESLKMTLNQDPFFQKQHSDYWSIKGDIYKDFNLFICTGGKAQFSQREQSFILEKGKVFLAVPGVPIFAEHLGDEYFTAVAQHFDLKVFGELDFFTLIDYSNFLEFSDWKFITILLSRYKKLVKNEQKGLEQHSLYNTILNEFIYDSFLSENKNSNENYNFIFQMLSYIQTHSIEKDVLEKALELSPYSNDYSSRVFRKRIGLPPKQFILKTRLTLSRNMLLQDYTIKDTAFRCGFSDELYFSRLFKKYIHINPTEFKKQYKNR